MTHAPPPPGVMATIAVAVSAKLTKRRRERELSPIERDALAQLRRFGLAEEWDIPIAVSAISKGLSIPPTEAAARIRAGLARALAFGTLRGPIRLDDALRAGLRPTPNTAA